MKQSKRNKIFKLKRAAALILAFILAFTFYQAAGNVYIAYAAQYDVTSEVSDDYADGSDDDSPADITDGSHTAEAAGAEASPPEKTARAVEYTLAIRGFRGMEYGTEKNVGYGESFLFQPGEELQDFADYDIDSRELWGESDVWCDFVGWTWSAWQEYPDMESDGSVELRELPDTMPDHDIVLWAVYEYRDVEVTYQISNWDGGFFKDDFGEPIWETVQTCWFSYLSGDVSPDTRIYGNETYQAAFGDETPYNNLGTVLKEEVLDKGGNAAAPSDPTRGGHYFSGWDVMPANLTGGTVNGNVDYTAQWQRLSGGGSSNPVHKPKPDPDKNIPDNPIPSAAPEDGTAIITPDISTAAEPPQPAASSNTLMPDGNDGFIEINDEDVPLGKWEQNENEDDWIFIPDEDVPLGIPLTELPKTDDAGWSTYILYLIGIAFICTGAVLTVKERKND